MFDPRYTSFHLSSQKSGALRIIKKMNAINTQKTTMQMFDFIVQEYILNGILSLWLKIYDI